MSMSEEYTFGSFSPVGDSGCAFCSNRLDLDDPDNYREVISWVHGPKLDGPVLREQTGRMAHKDCIDKLRQGQAPDQEKLL
jgi:hypothetical protein